MDCGMYGERGGQKMFFVNTGEFLRCKSGSKLETSEPRVMGLLKTEEEERYT